MPALPSGTVTFLFSDVEGSTQLLRRLGSSYADALAQHQQLLRAAFTAHGGVECGTEGDSFFVAFSRATDAVAACAAAQRAMSEHQWPPDGEFRVRMGLHTGEASVHDGQYVGMSVHLAARVAAAGHGGQVLLSETTLRLVGDALPPVLDVRDLGAFVLKDFSQPERIFQLLQPGLATDFPPLKAPAAAIGNLPPSRTAFIGRERELSELVRLVGEVALVTIVGAGGVGKTRLATEVARQATARLPDGAWLVELAALKDAGAVPAAVVAALGYEPQHAREPLDVLIANLRDRALLLVIDNCEHVISACADLVDRLLAECPQVTVLATSREPLGVSGERPWRLPSLPVPADSSGSLEELVGHDAVRLFVERAEVVRPGFTLTRTNAEAVVAICRRLDGIPLAIELAAARVRTLPVEAIATRLDDRFSLLTGGARSALSRQQTLRALVDWSHELLSEPERVVLRRLSVFTDGFTLEAAEEVVWGLGEQQGSVLDLTSALVDKSLVAAAAESGRLRMLETVREFAREKLIAAGDEVTGLRDRHLDWCLAFVEDANTRLNGPQHKQALDDVEREYGNLQAGLDWAVVSGGSARGLTIGVGLSYFWGQRGRISEGRERLESLLQLADPPPGLHARAMGVHAGLANLVGLPGALAEAQSALEAAEASGDPTACAVALFALGNAGDDAEQSLEYVVRARQCGMAERRDWEQLCLVQQARLRLALDDVEGARRDLDASRALAEALDSDYARFYPLFHGSRLHRGLGDLHQAQAQAQQALQLARKLGDPRLQAETLAGLGQLAALLGEAHEAHAHFSEALGHARRLGLLAWAVGYLITLAYLEMLLGWLGHARQSLDQAESLAGAGHPLKSTCLLARSVLEDACGNEQAAKRAFAELLELEPPVALSAHLHLGWLEGREGRSAAALVHYASALDLASEVTEVAQIGLCVAAVANQLALPELARSVATAALPAVDPFALAASLQLRAVLAATGYKTPPPQHAAVDRDRLIALVSAALRDVQAHTASSAAPKALT